MLFYLLRNYSAVELILISIFFYRQYVHTSEKDAQDLFYLIRCNVHRQAKDTQEVFYYSSKKVGSLYSYNS